MTEQEDRPFDLDELRVRTHRLAIDLPIEYNDYFTQVIESFGRLEAEIRTRADLCAAMIRGTGELNSLRAQLLAAQAERDAAVRERDGLREAWDAGVAELTKAADAQVDVCDRCTLKFKNISETLGIHTLVERLDVADLREFYDASLKEPNEP